MDRCRIFNGPFRSQSKWGRLRVNNTLIRPHCILEKNNCAFVVVLVLNLFELVMSSCLLCGSNLKKIHVYIYIHTYDLSSVRQADSGVPRNFLHTNFVCTWFLKENMLKLFTGTKTMFPLFSQKGKKFVEKFNVQH